MYKWKVLRKNKVLDIVVALDEIEAMQIATRLLEGRTKTTRGRAHDRSALCQTYPVQPRR